MSYLVSDLVEESPTIPSPKTRFPTPPGRKRKRFPGRGAGKKTDKEEDFDQMEIDNDETNTSLEQKSDTEFLTITLNSKRKT